MGSPLDPTQHLLSVCIYKAYHQHQNENGHLVEGEQAKVFKYNSPRVQENGFDIEDDKYQSEDVVADMELDLPAAYRHFATFIGSQFLSVGMVRP
jgi:hypothetical protein